MAISGDYDDNNIFAMILRGELPCAKVFENEHILAFMDAFPQSEGHTLVIPKAPSRNILDTSGKNLGRLIGTTQKIAAAINEALSPDGIVVTQFNGAPAGQTVFHLHFHIIPKYKTKMLGNHASEPADIDDLEQLAGRIRAALDQPRT